jgi:phage baseplate assembly protein W
MATLGTDISCYPDLDAAETLVSGRTGLAQAIARRLTTPRGGLFYDGHYGTDLRSFLSEGFGPDTQARVAAAIEAECRKDERVAGVSADVTFNPAAQSMKISVSLNDGDGPFTLTLSVTALTVELLTTTT